MQDDHSLMLCPPDQLFLVEVCERNGHMPPLPKDVIKLKAIIMEAIATINNTMLERIWQELDYRLDVYHVTNRAHIEHV